jgi:hypothetical protein
MTKLLLACFITACSLGGEVVIGKEFTLKKNETAFVKGASISVKVVSAGRSQHESGGDTIFCEANVTEDGKSSTINLGVGKAIAKNAYSIKLTSVDLKTDPKLADPWSNNSCSFVVTKKEK